MKTELEIYLSDSIFKINSFNEADVFDGLEKIDILLKKLCIKANPNNPSNYNSKSGRDLTIRSIHNKEYATNKPINELFNDKDTEKTAFTGTRKWKIPNKDDRIFGEFIVLQDLIEYNLVSNLINLLNWAIRDRSNGVGVGVSVGVSDVGVNGDSSDNGNERNTTRNRIICLDLKILQGCLLLHPNSRKLFHNEHSMSILIGLLNPVLNSSMRTNIIICCIPTLVSSLVRNVPNLRLFEQLDGPEIICNLLKGKNIATNHNVDDETEWQRVQVKVLEFLFFYLVPEFKSEQTQEQAQRQGQEHCEKNGDDGDDDEHNHNHNQTEIGIKVGNDGVVRRNMESKVQILNRYLNRDVTSGLMQEMIVSKPFGNMDIEW